MNFDEILEFAPNARVYLETMPLEIRHRITIRKFLPDTIILQKDSPLNSFGIVLKGEERVVNEFENGNLVMVERNSAVCFIGDVALLAGKKTASVTTESLSECTVLFISAEDFEKWIKEDSRFLLLLSREVAGKLFSASYSRGENLFYSAKYMLLKYIFKQAQEGVTIGKSEILIQKTRQQISEETGMNVKTINRRLYGFQKEGIIGIRKGKIIVTRQQCNKMPARLRSLMREKRNGGAALTINRNGKAVCS